MKDEYGHAYRLMIRDKWDGTYGEWQNAGSYRTRADAVAAMQIAKAGGYTAKDVKVVRTVKNPTKAQKREKARKAGIQRRVASALANFLKKANPAMKTCGAAVQRLKGGVLKITPIKATRGRK